MRQAAFIMAILGAAAFTNQASARADETAGPREPRKMRVTALFVLAPAGLLNSGAPGNTSTVGSVPAFGLATAFDFVAHPNVFVGFAAGYTFNVQPRGSTVEPATAFDLTFRLGGNFPVGRRFTAYGYLAPGYSLMRASRVAAPQGPVIGVHAGALFDLTPTLFLAAELGYQAGFQQASYNDMDLLYGASFFQTGIGLGVRI